MNITITVDTDTPLTDHDKSILLAVAGATTVLATVEEFDAPAASGSEPEEKKPRRTRRTKEQIAADEAAKKEAQASAKKEETPAADEADEDAAEDLLGGDKPTMQDAVARATELISDGKTALVKGALAEAGASRVSELDDAGIATFLAALK